jgi:hypothetical protein
MCRQPLIHCLQTTAIKSVCYEGEIIKIIKMKAFHNLAQADIKRMRIATMDANTRNVRSRGWRHTKLAKRTNHQAQSAICASFVLAEPVVVSQIHPLSPGAISPFDQTPLLHLFLRLQQQLHFLHHTTI